MGYHNYINSVLIAHLLSVFLNLSSSGALKGPDSIKGSGPLTLVRPWEAAVLEGCGLGILTSSFNIVKRAM